MPGKRFRNAVPRLVPFWERTSGTAFRRFTSQKYTWLYIPLLHGVLVPMQAGWKKTTESFRTLQYINITNRLPSSRSEIKHVTQDWVWVCDKAGLPRTSCGGDTWMWRKAAVINMDEPKNLERNLLHCSFVYHQSHGKSELNPGLRGEKPASSHLSYRTAHFTVKCNQNIKWTVLLQSYDDCCCGNITRVRVSEEQALL
jgi:hypothetical protein